MTPIERHRITAPLTTLRAVLGGERVGAERVRQALAELAAENADHVVQLAGAIADREKNRWRI